jgi:hypothetical protein
LPAAADAVAIDGVSVPGGWDISFAINPAVRLSSIYPNSEIVTPKTQLWVEFHEVRLTGFITFFFDGTTVGGDLWQDTIIGGTPHKKGESVKVRR